MIKLILSDVDGTLLRRGEGAFDNQVFEVIKELHNRNILFAAASGRGFGELQQLFKPVEDKMAFVCSDGAMTICNDSVIEINSMEREGVAALINDVTYTEGCEFLLYGREKLYIRPKTRAYEDFIRDKYRDNVCLINSPFEVRDDFLKLSIYAKNGVEKCSDHFEKKWCDSFEMVYNANNWIEFVSHGICKVSGVRALCRQYSINMDEVMAFGDGGNDIKLLGAVGYGYAMDYAPECVHCAAKFVTGDVMETIREEVLGGE